MAYESTNVPVERSQGEIRKLLTAHQAAQFAFGEERDEDARPWAAVQFSHAGLIVRIRVPHKRMDEAAFRAKVQRAHSRAPSLIRQEIEEQEARRIWRVMAHNLKARLIAVEEDVETFAEAFLAHLVNPATGRTVYEQLSEDGSIQLPSALLALPAGGGT